MLKPTGNRLLLKLTKDQVKNDAGLEIPEDTEPRGSGQGTIIDIGPKCELEWTKGETVHFVRFEGHIIEKDNIEYKSILETDIVAKEGE